MAGLERCKRKREYGFTESTGINSNSIKSAMDLFVPIPTKASTSGNMSMLSQAKIVEQLLSRLEDTGYGYIALTHTVNGNPRDPDDRANIAIPSTLYTRNMVKSNVTYLRRLHVIVENPSDMRIFNPQSVAQQKLLLEYDLISIAPRSDAVFQAACTCDSIDIVTLDGTTSTSNTLPYTIRSTDIRSIRNRRAVLEIPYAIPILNRNARKGLVQTCRSVITASLGGGSEVPATTSMIPMVFSSGNRCTTGSNAIERQSDVGSIALRTPDDLVNVLQSVLSFDTKTAVRSVTESGRVALNHGITRQKRHREQHEINVTHQQTISVVGVEVEVHTKRGKTVKLPYKTCATKNSSTTDPTSLNRSRTSTKPSTKEISTILDHDNSDNNDEDGFIAL